MPVTIDRLGPGTLTVGTGPMAFEMQVARCVLVPENTEDGIIPTLGDPFPAPEVTTTWSLEGDVVSDWGQEDGVINYCMDNANDLQDFVFVPNADTSNIQYSGTLRIVPLEIGGTVQEIIQTAFSFPLDGAPVRGTTTPRKAATVAKEAA